MTYRVEESPESLRVVFTESGWKRGADLRAVIGCLCVLVLIVGSALAAGRTAGLLWALPFGILAGCWLLWLARHEELIVTRDSVVRRMRLLAWTYHVAEMPLLHPQFVVTEQPPFWSLKLTPSTRLHVGNLPLGQHSLTDDEARELAAQLNAFVSGVPRAG